MRILADKARGERVTCKILRVKKKYISGQKRTCERLKGVAAAVYRGSYTERVIQRERMAGALGVRK